MAGAIRHRGPDGFGLAIDTGAGFVSTRLAIFDIPGGWQPLETDAGGGLLVYNGEVFNHPELRRELELRGEWFSTSCDTEVLLRLLQRDGLGALERLNGQFAFAWWQPERRRLTLARDRFGVRPLYYSRSSDDGIVFGSEAKALFASGEVSPAPDLAGVDEVFTLWGPRPPRTAFRGVSQVPAGSLIVWESGKVVERRQWWAPEYEHAGNHRGGDLGTLLRDSVRLRLRADVPVGTYLSGGLDSSLITALAQRTTSRRLRTFSIAFEDPSFDERGHQERVAKALGTDHHVVEAGPAQIANCLPEVIWHAETPLVRTAPAPLYLLARQVREHDLSVVLTGEGADELFWGYDLFKEVALRELHRSEPEQAARLLDRLYPYLDRSAGRRGPAWRRFLLSSDLDGDQLSSHLTRARATATVKAFYRAEVREGLGEDRALERLRGELPPRFGQMSSLERAAWLELNTLLEPNLLAAQGDRVSMAHGVEGRHPFLDYRVFEASADLPAERKLNGLQDKLALRELAGEILPPEIASRPKQPYRAPAVAPFFGPEAPGWVAELLSPEELNRTDTWDPSRVEGLLRRCRAGRVTGAREEMALTGILSFQLWHRAFMDAGLDRYPPETDEPSVRIDRLSRELQEV
jgi:asparagine synthase (glutamine-hydrolysing)